MNKKICHVKIEKKNFRNRWGKNWLFHCLRIKKMREYLVDIFLGCVELKINKYNGLVGDFVFFLQYIFLLHVLFFSFFLSAGETSRYEQIGAKKRENGEGREN